MTSPTTTAVTGPPIMNLLWSYAYARTMDMDDFLGKLPCDSLRFFADSGAHSARTLGIHIGLEDYAAWVQRWSRWFTIYANLDVIGAPEATWDNQRRLEDEYGLHPMPVFHTGEPFSALERYLDAGYTYIALGKLLGNSAAALRPWLTKAFRIAEGRAVFHGFGMTNWPMLREFPFYSVDSSSWGSGFRYGYLKLFHNGRWAQVWLGKRDSIAKHRRMLDAYGIPYSALNRNTYDRLAVAGVCAAAVYRCQQWLRRHHGPIELPPGKGYPPPHDHKPPKVVPAITTGLHTYLAEGSTTGHERHAAGLHLYLADSSRKATNAGADRINKERT